MRQGRLATSPKTAVKIRIVFICLDRYHKTLFIRHVEKELSHKTEQSILEHQLEVVYLFVAETGEQEGQLQN